MSLKPLIAFTALAAISLPAAAQRIERSQNSQQEGGQTQAQGPQSTKIIPTIRTSTYDRLQEAQMCMDEKDYDCVKDTLDKLAQVRDLNNYEMANIWQFRAYLAFDLDDMASAIDAYEKLLALPFEDMPDGLIQNTMRNLASLYVQEEQYQKGLDTFMRWMALPTVTPTGDDHYMLATIYYQMDKPNDGIPEIQQAIELASQQGEIGDEAWYQMLYVFYFQLEQQDNVIDTLKFMVEHWTRPKWVLALAGQLSSQGRDDETLTLYELAYESGWLMRGTEWVQLANLYLNGEAPYKAALVLQKGLDNGIIESTLSNWRLLAQAYQLAQEHEKAIPAFQHASTLAEDGDVDRMLAQSYQSLGEWDECAKAARDALDRGGLDRSDLVYLMLGNCLMNGKEYQEARNAFQQAAKDDRVAATARDFIRFTDDLIERDRSNKEALASLQASAN